MRDRVRTLTRHTGSAASVAGVGVRAKQAILVAVVLTGQLAPGARRSTWEQPATAWAAQLESCGYREVEVEPLYDYWSSPAFLLTARA